MSPTPLHILAINSGSSSIKFAVYVLEPTEHRLLSARCDGIGTGAGRFLVKINGEELDSEHKVCFPHHDAALRTFLDWLCRHSLGSCLDGVGHRVVHGGPRFTEPVVVTDAVAEALAALRPYDPEQMVPELGAIELAREMFPHSVHVACFDTAFHRDMPRLAQMYALPRKMAEEGIIRFGSHGLSCEYLLERLAAEAGFEAAQGRVIVAHLGGESSMAAIKAGRSVDSTTGYSPNGGLMMGTRPGDLCPGVLLDLLLRGKYSLAQLNELINFQSGLLGVSGLSRDMSVLLGLAATNPSAAEAIELYCYNAKKHLASMAAALGGIDTLVFSGGIGEHAVSVRRMICDQMRFLGISLDPVRNRQNEPVISSEGSPVTVRVIATNEELVIARAACRLAKASFKEAHHRLTARKSAPPSEVLRAVGV